jgi:hypothetical protein
MTEICALTSIYLTLEPTFNARLAELSTITAQEFDVTAR